MKKYLLFLFLSAVFINFEHQTCGASAPSSESHQIIVKFSDTLNAPADVVFSQHRSFASVLSKPDDLLDQLISKYKVLSIRTTFSNNNEPHPAVAQKAVAPPRILVTDMRSQEDANWTQEALQTPKSARPPSLHHIYIFTLDPTVDTASAVKDFRKDPNLVSVHRVNQSKIFSAKPPVSVPSPSSSKKS